MNEKQYTFAIRKAYPLDLKIKLSRDRIRRFYESFQGDVYVSYSGGKDSAVLRELVWSVYSNEVPLVFIDTGIEYPEVRKNAMSYADVRIKPKRSFFDIVEQYGFPLFGKEVAQQLQEIRTTHSDKLRNYRLNQLPKKYQKFIGLHIGAMCCNYLKKSPAKKYEKQTGRHAYLGIRAGESMLRMQRPSCNVFDAARPSSAPLLFWTEKDILDFIYANQLQIPSVYGKIVYDAKGNPSCTGEQRTGCVFCGFGITREKAPNKYQRLKETHPAYYNVLVNKYSELLNKVSVPY